jgi:hypothetical protein
VASRCSCRPARRWSTSHPTSGASGRTDRGVLSRW